jgi:hypothetical protein
VKTKLLVAAVAVVVLATPAGAMDVATYLSKVEALRRQGSLTGIFSSEYAELRTEIAASGASLRQERLAAVAAGRRAAYCPPAGAGLTTEEIYSAMSAVPPAQRQQTPVRFALLNAYARKYPCPA